jgi:site-specific DNA-methyltransferase (adenine-specific)
VIATGPGWSLHWCGCACGSERAGSLRIYTWDEAAADPSVVAELLGCLCPEHGLASLDEVDHVITDAPYSDDTKEGARTGNRRCKHQPHLTFSIGASLLGEALAAAAPLRWVVAFCDWQHLLPLKTEPPRGLRWHQACVWTKHDSAPRFNGDGPGGGWEACATLHASDQRRRWNAGGKRGVWRHGVQKNAIDTVGHPTAKPLPLMVEIVRDFTDPGELICDPFAGSGTTGVAAIRLGRRFIGWERDPGFFEVARKRLESTREQCQLFEARPRGKQVKLL